MEGELRGDAGKQYAASSSHTSRRADARTQPFSRAGCCCLHCPVFSVPSPSTRQSPSPLTLQVAGALQSERVATLTWDVSQSAPGATLYSTDKRWDRVQCCSRVSFSLLMHVATGARNRGNQPKRRQQHAGQDRETNVGGTAQTQGWGYMLTQVHV